MKELTDLKEKSFGAESSAAARGFAAKAADLGLVDIAYAKVDSPFGPLLAAVTPRGLIRLSYHRESMEEVVEQLCRSTKRVLEVPSRLDEVRRQLDEYFDGSRSRFDVPLDWSFAGGFTRKVLRATARIPYGQVRSYTQVAVSAGSPRASRAAGNALNSNPMPIIVPCHRVLRGDGSLGGYGGGLEVKKYLLKLEEAI